VRLVALLLYGSGLRLLEALQHLAERRGGCVDWVLAYGDVGVGGWQPTTS